MKRVVIIGKGSYIGTQLKEKLCQMPQQYEVLEMDAQKMLDASMLKGADCAVHVAGIAHRKEQAGEEKLYDSVNRALAVTAARAAKKCGVRQFVFFSSMSVYGLVKGRITKDSIPSPKTFYGQSKWAAEQELSLLCDDAFRVAVLRPPMIYGKGCRGNYPRLAKLAVKLPFFPYFRNQRSMLYIENLTAFVQKLIESEKGGLYFPQNESYVSTCDMVRTIAACHGKNLPIVKGFGHLLSFAANHVGTAAKVVGSLTYDLDMSRDFLPDEKLSFDETIRRTEEQG